MSEEEHARAGVGEPAGLVPGDLRLPVEAVQRRQRNRSPLGARARLAAGTLAVLLVVGGVLLSQSGAAGPAHPTPPPGGSTVAASGGPDAAFPAKVAGLPVISVAHALGLLGSGKLDGQVVAVAGYYDAVYPPCPYPGRYIGPLESWCSFASFSDTRAGARLCRQDTTGMSCQAPTGVHLTPFFMGETSGDANAALDPGATREPAAVVLIGHAGDPRQWQCSSATQVECAHAFVVDRIAWAAGQEIAAAAPQIGDQHSGKAVTPKLTLEQVAAEIGPGDTALTAAALRAGDIATVDPRWNLAGDGVVWLVRSFASGAAPQGEEARPATVTLVDDATGRVLDGKPLKVDAAYQPARLWQMATVRGLNCCAGSEMAFYSVAASGGMVVYDGFVTGWPIREP